MICDIAGFINQLLVSLCQDQADYSFWEYPLLKYL